MPTAVVTVFFSMSLMAVISTFVRSSQEGTLEPIHLVAFLYFVLYRLKVYLDDDYFYHDVFPRVSRKDYQKYQGWEWLLASASWIIWISVAILVTSPGPYFLLTAVNFLLAFAWIMFNGRATIDWDKDTTQPKLRYIYRAGKWANLIAIFACSILSLSYFGALPFGAQANFRIRVLGSALLGLGLIFDLCRTHAFTLRQLKLQQEESP